MEVYRNKFCSIVYNSTSSIVELHWAASSCKITVEDYKNELSIYANFIEKYKPKKVLFNAQKLNYIILPEVQTWISKNVNPKMNNCVEKMSLTMSENYITQLSLQQMLDDDVNSVYSKCLFTSPRKAIEWLLND